MADGGWSAADVVAQAAVQTPAYVYDLGEVRANAARLLAALPEPTGLYYSLKANPHPAVLATLRAAGVAPEVCSPGELVSALDAGWPAEQVFYTGPGKRDDDLASAIRLGVGDFSVDSPFALDQLDRVAGEMGVAVRCLLRINDEHPTGAQGLAMGGVASQFGADVGWVLAEPERFSDRPHVRVAGLHFYMGSNVTDLLAQFNHELRTAAAVSRVLGPHIGGLDVLDLGGGFGAPYAKQGPPVDLTGLRAGLERLLDEHVPGWRSRAPHVVFESGRHLVATAGALVARVLDVKLSHGREVVVLESGINHLGGMAGLRRLPPVNPDLAVPRPDDVTTPTIVTGPLCTPLDSWSRAAPLPPLRPGDLVAVPNVGAYGLYASLLAFLGHPTPLEVVVDHGRVVHRSRLHVTRKE